MPEKERLERKKYMVMWRWESLMVAKMMSRSPKMVTINMDKKRSNIRTGILVLLRVPIEEPRIHVSFPGSIWLV